jgi:mono/diheme cytochrome c family protein
MRAALLLLPLIALVVLGPAPRAEEASESAAFETTVRPFLSAHCYACHNPERKRGQLDMESLPAVADDPDTWEQIVLKMRTGEMPPEEKPRPAPAELERAAGWIEHAIERADAMIPPNPGRVTARRLNRTEYNNTIRDLLGVDLRPADDFPQDDAGYGFDNIGDVLSLSPVLMERYVTAADRIARTALFGPVPMKPTLVRLQSRTAKIEPSPTPRLEYDETGLSLPQSAHATHRFPVDGEYLVRVVVGGQRPAGSAPFRVGLWIDGELVDDIELDPLQEASFSDSHQDLAGMAREFRVRVKAGERWVAASLLRLYEGLPASYGAPNPSPRPLPTFTPPPGAPPERVERLRAQFEARLKETAPANAARISHLEVGGPYEHVTGPSADSLEKIYVCGHLHGGHGPVCARTIVSNLARRAFRRPVPPQELDVYLGLVRLAEKEGDSFEEGIALGLQAILVSPDFLFRIEGGRFAELGDEAHPITPHQLASRLSYFLWASMPDEELLRTADEGTLSRPDVLAAQVRRMLNDPKARALVEEFGGQWLQVRALESVAPDRDRFPDFDNYLRLSMRRETELFFETIVREDRPVLEFLDADYTFLNDRLARHYGVEGIRGSEFRRVALKGSRRGGVLTQASVLTVSSYATRTSPVLRGKWILENLLDAPPPDPPAGVPALDEIAIGSSASLRKQMEAHRVNPTCAACHMRMDPLGFALENYDAIGQWRDMEGDFPIDASGTLPDGRAFQGADELKGILKEDREAFARAITSKLLTYALGRGLERYDRRTVRQISSRLADHEYRFSGLVLEIVKSLPFQMRQPDPPSDPVAAARR